MDRADGFEFLLALVDLAWSYSDSLSLPFAVVLVAFFRLWGYVVG